MAKKTTGNPAAAGRRVEVVPGRDIPTFYVNQANIELSTWDMRLRFGQLESAGPDFINVKETLVVFMSHSHARAFAKALNNAVAKIDKIPPPDLDKINE